MSHTQLARVLDLLGLPPDFVKVVQNLYKGASTCYITPHGCTDSVEIHRGTLQGDPLSPLLFDLMVELIRWLEDGTSYRFSDSGQTLSSKWYADDATLVTDSLEAMQALCS